MSQAQWPQIPRDGLKASKRSDISFGALKCHCSGNTSKLLKVLWQNYSLVFPPLPFQQRILSCAFLLFGYFHVLPALSSNSSSSSSSVLPFCRPHLPHPVPFISSRTVASLSFPVPPFFPLPSLLSLQHQPFSLSFPLSLLLHLSFPSWSVSRLPSRAGPGAE